MLALKVIFEDVSLCCICSIIAQGAFEGSERQVDLQVRVKTMLLFETFAALGTDVCHQTVLIAEVCPQLFGSIKCITAFWTKYIFKLFMNRGNVFSQVLIRMR